MINFNIYVLCADFMRMLKMSQTTLERELSLNGYTQTKHRFKMYIEQRMNRTMKRGELLTFDNFILAPLPF